jgi:hypothetical protein
VERTEPTKNRSERISSFYLTFFFLSSSYIQSSCIRFSTYLHSTPLSLSTVPSMPLSSSLPSSILITYCRFSEAPLEYSPV